MIMFIAGTVRNTLTLTALDSKWQQKKQENPTKKTENMTADQLQLQRFQEELKKARENKSPEIAAKLMAGEKLTREEIEYLRKNDPQKLKEYEEIQQERASYKKQLKSCKSKEEVERLKMNRMGKYLAQAKGIASSSVIPKSAKYNMMVKLLAEAKGVVKEHIKFTQSLRYAELPEYDEDAKKKPNAHTEELPKEDTGTADITPKEENAELLEEIKLIAEAFDAYTPAAAQDTAPQTTGDTLDVKA